MKLALATLAVLLVGGIGFQLRKPTAPPPGATTERASIFVLQFPNADTNGGESGLRTDPAWDGLREEPEFKKLIEKVGLDGWLR